MNSSYLCLFDEIRKPNWEDLVEEFNLLKEGIRTLEQVNVPEEMKAPILKELNSQISEVRQKMHNYVDAL